MSCWVTRKRQGSPKRKLFTLTELGWTLKEIFYTPKGSLFLGRNVHYLIELPLSLKKFRLESTSEVPQGVVGGKGQQIPTGPLSSGLHSAERVSAGIDYP